MAVRFTSSNPPRRLTRADFVDDAAKIGCDEACLRAVIEVESAGSGFDKRDRIKILFEPHVFYRHLSGAMRDKAVAAGLAYKAWRPGNYPADSYPRLAQALALDETAALLATSFGLPQILGENFKAAGYDNPQHMVAAFVESEDEQVEAMGRFIKSKRLDRHLRALAWDAFATGYNGAAQRKHNYAGRLAAAYAKWKRKLTTVEPEKAALQETQTTLKNLNYAEVGEPDGNMGSRTVAAIAAFQHDNELPVTGTVTPETAAALDNAPKERPISEARATGEPAESRIVQGADNIGLIGKITATLGVSGGAAKVAEQVDAFKEPVATIWGVLHPIIDTLGTYIWLPIGGVGALLAYEAFKVRKARIEDHQSGKTT